MLRREVKCLRPTMYSPSGDHAGALSRRKSSLVIGLASPVARPSAKGRTQMLSPPPRSLVKASHLPSGEKRGCMSQAIPEVSATASPPAIGRT